MYIKINCVKKRIVYGMSFLDCRIDSTGTLKYKKYKLSRCYYKIRVIKLSIYEYYTSVSIYNHKVLKETLVESL